MATVLAIVTDAYYEIGVVGQGQPLPAELAQLGLRRFQNQLDSWQADRLTLSFQGATPITWPASTSTQTLGPGGNVVIQRPVFINQINYVNPGSSPANEVVMGPMDQDQYAALSLKGLQSGLPQLYFYQTSVDDLLGTLFIWPQPTQTITLDLYAPKGVAVPTALTDLVVGPPGYAEAFMYQLAPRLAGPLGVQVQPYLAQMAQSSFATMKRPNVDPGLLGIDPALVPYKGAGYNVLSDVTSVGGNR